MTHLELLEIIEAADAALKAKHGTVDGSPLASKITPLTFLAAEIRNRIGGEQPQPADILGAPA